jgi:hypothetical protein
VVESRGRLGDWEGDLITGRINQSAIGTLVDRASRYVKLIHLPDGRSAPALRDALTLAVVDLPPELRRTRRSRWRTGELPVRPKVPSTDEEYDDEQAACRRFEGGATTRFLTSLGSTETEVALLASRSRSS